MKPTILLLITLIMTVVPVKGQDPKSLSGNKSYVVSIRSGRNQVRELCLLPMVHKGGVKELSFETEKVKNSLRQFQFLLTYSRVRTRLEEMAKSANLRIGMNYSYNFPVIKENNLIYYAGPQASLCYSFMLYPNWDESHTYWADYLTIGANNILSVSLRNDKEWFSSLNFSLASLFSRPDDVRPYKMDDYSPGGFLSALNSNIEPGLMNRVLLINFKTEYRFPVLSGKREAITFNTDFIRISRKGDAPVFQIINMLGIKIML